jgi:hypothetical protein
MSLPDAVHEVISHFLTEFSPDEGIWKTESYILKFLTRRYSAEVAEDLTAKYFTSIRNSLIEEHDRRIENSWGQISTFYIDIDNSHGVNRLWIWPGH